jgi:plasmid stabilization system protein ParE
MPRLIWSPHALGNVKKIYHFLLDENPEVAKRAVSSIRMGVKILSQHPEAGRPFSEEDVEYREWVIAFGTSGYVALYRQSLDHVVILAVRHQKEAGYHG